MKTNINARINDNTLIAGVLVSSVIVICLGFMALSFYIDNIKVNHQTALLSTQIEKSTDEINKLSKQNLALLETLYVYKEKEKSVASITNSIHHFNSKLSIGFVKRVSEAVYQASKIYHVPSNLLVAIAWKETNFQTAAKSSVGALGFMQIMPAWVKDQELKQETGIEKVRDLYVVEHNVMAGAYIYSRYKAYWSMKYKDEHQVAKLTLLSYNRGITTVINDLKADLDPANGYAIDVLSNQHKIKHLF